jgi:hypothetical protein
MPRRQAASRLRINREASARIKSESDWFAKTLTAHSKSIADIHRSNEILEHHVEEALVGFRGLTRRHSIWYDWGSSLGVLVFGIAVPFFIQELDREDIRAKRIIAWVVIGFLSAALAAVPKLYFRSK